MYLSQWSSQKRRGKRWKHTTKKKKTLHKKKRNAVIFFKDLKVDIPLAGGPLDKNPTLRRAGLAEIWSRMILAPGKSALARLDFAAKRIILSDSLLFCCIFWTLLQRGSHWVTHYRSATSSGLCCRADHTEWLTIGLLHLLDFEAKGITSSDGCHYNSLPHGCQPLLE